MHQLFLFSENPQFPGEILISGALESRFEIKKTVGLDPLIAQLSHLGQQAHPKQEGETVCMILMQIAAPRIQETLSQIRQVCPKAICIAILDPEHEKEVKVYDWPCLFLARPLNDLSLQSVMAAALKLHHLETELSLLVQLDATTHLFNQDYFIQRLSQEVALSKRHTTQFSTVVISIGLYQMFLDSYGHHFTNKLLNTLSDILKAHVRQEDVLARVGDDELAMFLPRTTAQGAKILVSRIFKQALEKPFSHQGFEEELALFAGIIEYPNEEHPHLEGDGLIRYARHALHRARQEEEDGDVIQIFSNLYPI